MLSSASPPSDYLSPRKYSFGSGSGYSTSPGGRGERFVSGSPYNNNRSSFSPARFHNTGNNNFNQNANNSSDGSQPYRLRWTEHKKMMTAEEIDSIIRMQESQLNNAGTNGFAEDYYHQTLAYKKRISTAQSLLQQLQLQQQALQNANNINNTNSGATDTAGQPTSAQQQQQVLLLQLQQLQQQQQQIQNQLYQFSLHKPLFESNQRILRKSGYDPLEGVLGRIPSHSVRAPRPLLQIKANENNNNNNTGGSTTTTIRTSSSTPTIFTAFEDDKDNRSNSSSKAIQSLLLIIENAWSALLDIEDIDLILKNAQLNPTHHFNVNHLRTKRDELTVELYKALHVNYNTSAITLPNNHHLAQSNEEPFI